MFNVPLPTVSPARQTTIVLAVSSDTLTTTTLVLIAILQAASSVLQLIPASNATTRRFTTHRCTPAVHKKFASCARTPTVPHAPSIMFALHASPNFNFSTISVLPVMSATACSAPSTTFASTVHQDLP